jgi:hypothetical protein
MMRLLEKMMNARRKVQRMVIPFANLATPQAHFFKQTLRDGSALSALLHCSPLIWNNQTARLTPAIALKALSSHNRNLLKQAQNG